MYDYRKDFEFTESAPSQIPNRKTKVFLVTFDREEYINIGIIAEIHATIKGKKIHDVSGCESFTPEEAKQLRDALLEVYPLDK